MPELEIYFLQTGIKSIYTIKPNKRVISIGRGDRNKINLNDYRVSRQHARLIKTADGYVIEDLDSQNGTFVNKKKISSQLLKDNDEIFLGGYKLIFHSKASPAEADLVRDNDSQAIMLTVQDSMDTIKPLVSKEFFFEGTLTEMPDLEKNNKILYILYNLTIHLKKNSYIDDLLKKFMDLLFDVIDADHGLIAISGTSAAILIPKVIKKKHESRDITKDFSVNSTIKNMVLNEKKAVLTSNTYKLPKCENGEKPLNDNILSLISVPLWRKDEVIGLVQIGIYGKNNQFTNDDLKFVSSITCHIAMILDEAYSTELNLQHRFVQEIFGYYLPSDMIDAILQSPEAIYLGGDTRSVAILISNIKGFSAISEYLPATEIVEILNIYLEAMTEIILKYHGTIDGFIGDSITVVFGAPIHHGNESDIAVACAIEMQLAVVELNELFKDKGYHGISIGIGINTGQAAVGNVGAIKCTKYGVVGRVVNIASGIESFSIGGQILISESTKASCIANLLIDDHFEIMTKGLKEPETIYQVAGIGKPLNLYFTQKQAPTLSELKEPLLIQMSVIETKYRGSNIVNGQIVKLSENWAEIEAETTFPRFTNLRIAILKDKRNKKPFPNELYCKVMEDVFSNPPVFRVNLTMIPAGIRKLFEILTLKKLS